MDPWIERHIFPGAIPPSLGQMMAIFEPHDFSVLDAENLRLHYALTLRHWLFRFEHARGQILKMFDEPFVRTWRQYLAGSLAAFEAGGLQLFQVLFAPGGNHGVPSTRRYQYEGATPSPSWFVAEPMDSRGDRFLPAREGQGASPLGAEHNGDANDDANRGGKHGQNGQTPRSAPWNAATS
jgi:hypothetical protein